MSREYTLCESAEFHDLLADYIHGATVLTRQLLSLIASVAEKDKLALDDLKKARKMLQRSHPEMVSLSKAVALISQRLENGQDPGRASKELEESWLANMNEVVKIAAEYLTQHRYRQILTISHSGLVRDAILDLKRQGSTAEVYVGEGRPRYEGLALARELSEKGVSCTVFADSAFAGFMGQIDCVLVGTDAVGPDTILNKIGTTAILREAQAREVPAAAIFDFLKVVDAEDFPEKLAEYPADELLTDPIAKRMFSGKEADGRGKGLRYVNRYIEVVPRRLIDTELAGVEKGR